LHPIYDYEQKKYCVLHYPGDDKKTHFERVVRRRLERRDYNFRAVWFPANFNAQLFSSHTFCDDSNADFGQSLFRGKVEFGNANFLGTADFSSAKFCKEANFTGARFHQDVSFYSAEFEGNTTFGENTTFCKDADFRETRFSRMASFRKSRFCEVAHFTDTKFYGERTLFEGTVFCKEAMFHGTEFFNKNLPKNGRDDIRLGFHNAEFRDSVEFKGRSQHGMFPEAAPTVFNETRIDKPEDFYFNSVTMRPSWFINARGLRELNFTEVQWRVAKTKTEVLFTHPQKRKERGKDARSRYSLLWKTSQELATNAEENRHYLEASDLGYLAMDARRKANLYGSIPFFSLLWWYWALNGYSERYRRTLLWLLVVFAGFVGLYAFIGFPPGAPMHDPNKAKASSNSANSQLSVESPGIPSVNGAAVSSRSGCGQLLWRTWRTTTGVVKGQERTDISKDTPSCWESVWRAAPYSLGVMVRAAPQPRPETATPQTLVVLEGILGPLLLALFALSIRRKFMR